MVQKCFIFLKKVASPSKVIITFIGKISQAKDILIWKIMIKLQLVARKQPIQFLHLTMFTLMFIHLITFYVPSVFNSIRWLYCNK